MLIALEGLPGKVKTSIARKLSREPGAVHLRIASDCCHFSKRHARKLADTKNYKTPQFDATGSNRPPMAGVVQIVFRSREHSKRDYVSAVKKGLDSQV